MSGAFRVAIDIGGTFTDGVLIDTSNGEMWTAKSLSTPSDPTEGFLEVLERLIADSGKDPGDAAVLVHATTVATNAVIERKGARTALVTTDGFRDVLQIGRQVRSDLYNLQTEKPVPLVERRHTFEVPERVGFDGRVIQTLDEECVRDVARRISSLSPAVEALAVCFIHAFVNPAHERRALALIREELPEIQISLSSDVAPEVREYWRFSTTALNAYLSPVCSTYIGRLESRAQGLGLRAPLRLMESSGGIMSIDSAKNRPILLLESGPAAAVNSAAFFARLLGFSGAIAFDMGGTTAKVGLITDGRASVLPEFEVGSAGGSGTGLAKGSGYPVLAPVVDLVEVGAGGGSVAWADEGSALRVGPRSAGADPGPACYGRGGQAPTVTDANVVLGRLDPEYFLGGALRLEDSLAESSVRQLAVGLGLTVEACAAGIVAIANATMSDAIRQISVHRGRDPRSMVLVATGGAGPGHAVQLAANLGMRRVIVPPSSGVCSAIGMLVSELRHDFRTTHQGLLDQIDLSVLSQTIEHSAEGGISDLVSEGLDKDEIDVRTSLEMRYRGQSWCLPVAVDRALLAMGKLSRETLRDAFEAEHARMYGYKSSGDSVEVVNVSVTTVGRPPHGGALPVLASAHSGVQAAKVSPRHVYFEGTGWVNATVHDRYGLLAGDAIKGPAVIEEVEATTLVPPGWTAEVMRSNALLIEAD